MKIEIKNFDFKYWDQFVDMINNYWEKNHPIINRDLFEWQYTGFGEDRGVENSKILLVNGELAGFRGLIPNLFQVGEKYPIKGCSFAIWLIIPKFRGQGLGHAMLKEIEKEFPVILTLGSNLKTSTPIYRSHQYSFINHFARYVIPLDIDKYQVLSGKNIDGSNLKNWFNSLDFSQSLEPHKGDSKLLAEMWQNVSDNVFYFGLHRNKEFFEWRYINSIGYRYLFFGDKNSGGSIIARVEPVVGKDIENYRVLRIIEIIPSNHKVLNGFIDNRLTQLLKNVLTWAKMEGCAAADFHFSNSNLSKILKIAGFKEQNENYGPPIASLAGLFQPFKYEPTVVNCHWSISKDIGNSSNIKQNDTYFVKSDGDRDRTNFWPPIN